MFDFYYLQDFLKSMTITMNKISLLSNTLKDVYDLGKKIKKRKTFRKIRKKETTIIKTKKILKNRTIGL